MPTYFFDLINGDELVEDDQREDFADIEAAKLEGLASARELLADAAKKGIWRLAQSTSFATPPATSLRRSPSRTPSNQTEALWSGGVADNITPIRGEYTPAAGANGGRCRSRHRRVNPHCNGVDNREHDGGHKCDE